jgi:glycosyltransferase involved in cell wall biosynthesis
MKENNKICVYAICKNESKFVDKWLESMSEADYVVVLDTGSTDGTYEMLKEDKRVYRVEQKQITPWRFDTARNESMKLIPEDANILLCTDLDEILESGWGDIIRNTWDDDLHVRGWYKYIWKHNGNGDPERVFHYDKLHNRNYHWKSIVHEMLVSDVYSEEYERNHICYLFDSGVTLHHYPDPTKSRANYLPMLKIRCEEEPDDYNAKIYLAHELCYRSKYEESTELLKSLIPELPKHGYDSTYVASCYLFIGDNYRAVGDRYEAIKNYLLAIKAEKTYREPYLAIGEIYNELGLYQSAVGMVKDAIKNGFRRYNWLERNNSWRDQPDDILSVAYYYIDGKMEKAYLHALSAHELNPTDERIANNLELCKKALSNK